MAQQKVKFVTGFGSFGGSTIALLEHCRLLSEFGFETELYAPGQWHLGRFSGSKDISEFYPESEDVLVFHHMELGMRPKCRRCLLYVHEKSLWNLKSKNLVPFDSILYVSESQRAFHGVDGLVVPNPVRRMVDISEHHPPGRNIAGVVGTIQPRKMQHVSIQRALADGRSEVLLFGDFVQPYFDEMIQPLLCDRVRHVGLVDPDSRMDMYNSFDHLYAFSSDESASLILGECRVLGKEVFKSDEVDEYEILDDKEIVARWTSVFEDNFPILGKFLIAPSVGKLERLVCVVTHNRKDLVSRWLRAWNSAEKFGAKVAVFHACDSQIPDATEMANILAHNPDFYIPFRNSALRDMGALRLALGGSSALPEWDSIFWFTDDMMPMRGDFLKPFVQKLTGKVGLVAQCYEPSHGKPEPGHGCLPHIRTVAYALSRAAADSLVFPGVGSDGEKPYLFEHGRVGFYEDHILRQVLDGGFEFALCHSGEGSYVHWTGSQDWLWDCHLFSDGAVVAGRIRSSHEMWSLYESQFAKPGSLDPLVIFTPEYCEKMTLKRGRVSAIMPTFSCPMNCFMWSVLSLILRSDPAVLDHLFISINGPDSREGGNELQDRKQAFLEDLRSADWSGLPYFNPGAMTISRTWSRVGHAQALEQCIPWVDTEYYLVMHDDVIVNDPSWCELAGFGTFVAKTWGNHLSGKLGSSGGRLDLPHMNTIFTLCHKPSMTSSGARWIGFHIDERFEIERYRDLDSFLDEHSRLGSLGFGALSKGRSYDSASLDIGSFLFSKIATMGMTIGRFDPRVVTHFESASWRSGQNYQIPELNSLKSQIMSVPVLADIYLRHADDEG